MTKVYDENKDEPLGQDVGEEGEMPSEEEDMDFDDGIEPLKAIEDLDELQEEEEKANMGNRLITHDHENDGDADYYYDEEYFEK